MMDSSLVYDRPPPSWWQLGPALWLGATAVLLFAYLFFNIPGSWFSGSTPQQFPGASMKVFTGTAQAEDGKMVITGTDTRNAVILGLETPYISTQEYGLLALDIEGVPDNVEVTLFWRNDLAPNKMFTRPLSVAGGRVQDVIVAGDSNWLGRIHSAAHQGSVSTPRNVVSTRVLALSASLTTHRTA